MATEKPTMLKVVNKKLNSLKAKYFYFVQHVVCA